MGMRNKTCFVLFTPDTDSSYSKVFMVMILIALMVYIILANLFMLVALWNTTDKFRLPQRLLVFLCACDLWTGCFTIPIEIYTLINHTANRCFVRSLQTFTMSHTPWLSGLTLVFICFLRYVTVTNSILEYFIKGKKAFTICSTMFAISTLFALWDTVGTYKKSTNIKSSYYLTTAVILTILLALLIYVNSQLASHIKEVALSFPKSNAEITATRDKLSYTGVTRTIRTMSMATAISYSPSILTWFITGIIYRWVPHYVKYTQNMVLWAHMFIYLNGGLNATIYILSTKNMSKFHKTMTQQEGLNIVHNGGPNNVVNNGRVKREKEELQTVTGGRVNRKISGI